MKKIKMTALICAMLLCLAAFTGCAADTQELAKVNGVKLTRGEFRFYLENMKELMVSNLGLKITDEESWSTVEIENRKAIDVAKEKALDDAVSLMVQVQRAKEAGITLTDSDKLSIGKQKNSLIESFGGEEGFNQQLRKWQISSSQFDTILQNYMYASKLKAKTIQEDPSLSDVSEDEILSEYDKSVQEYARETLHVKHILIALNPQNGDPRTDEQALARAQEVVDKLNAGAEFESLIAEYSDDPGQPEDGYSFIHNDGSMLQEFDDAAYALAVGDTSGPIKSEYGYHIIKRYKPLQEPPSLEESRDSIISAIQSARYAERVEEWKAAAEIVKNEAVYNEIK